MATTEQRPFVARQGFGVRGVAVELGVATLGAVVGPLYSRADTDPVTIAVVVGVGAVLFRLLIFSGPHRRRIVVDGTSIRFGRSRFALLDVAASEVTSRRALRERARELAGTHDPPGPRQALILTVRTPEGIAFRFGFAVDDAEALADAIEQRRTRAVDRPTVPGSPRKLPLRCRQGADPRWVVPALVAAAGLDVWIVAGEVGGIPVFAAMVAAPVLWTASRRIEIDEVGVRTRGLAFRWEELASVRLVPFGEALQIPRRHQRAPFWARGAALILLESDQARLPADIDRRRAVVIAVPGAVVLPAVAPRAGSGGDDA